MRLLPCMSPSAATTRTCAMHFKLVAAILLLHSYHPTCCHSVKCPHVMLGATTFTCLTGLSIRTVTDIYYSTAEHCTDTTVSIMLISVLLVAQHCAKMGLTVNKSPPLLRLLLQVSLA